MSCGHCTPILGVFFLVSSSFQACLGKSMLSQRLKGDPCISGVLFLCSPLLCVLCPAISICLPSSQNSALFSEPTSCWFTCPFPASQLESILKAVGWVHNHRAYLAFLHTLLKNAKETFEKPRFWWPCGQSSTSICKVLFVHSIVMALHLWGFTVSHLVS